MAGAAEELPLFPLNVVLFPYATLQIHVFEDRYRDMVRHCLQYDQGFGIVLIKTGSEVGGPADPYLVGTACRIVSVQTHDDGTMDVKIQGERRFRIRKLDETKTFPVGYVEPVVELEVEDTPRADALTLRTREYLQAYIEAHFQREEIKVAKVRLPQDPTALSFVVANFLQIDNQKKQHLLEVTDTLERISEMIPILEQHMMEAKLPQYTKLTVQDLSEWTSTN